jgi:hypothetical protein
MEIANLSLSSIKLCSPIVIFIVYVIVSAISLFLTRSSLKKFKSQRMENLYNLYSWSEVKLTIILGVILYGLCQYDQMNLAWIYLIFPIIYIILKNTIVFAYVSIAQQNSPKDIEPEDILDNISDISGPASGANILPEPPIVKKEIDTTIFGMRGDQDGSLKKFPPTPPTIPMSSSSIDQIENWTGGPGIGGGGIGQIGGGMGSSYGDNGLDSYFNNGL